MPKAAAASKASKSSVFIGTNTADLSAESSWTKIGRLKEVSGSLGDTWRTADATVLDSDFELAQKVLRNGGELELTVFVDLGDAGQDAIVAAQSNGAGAPYNFKIELGDKPAGTTSKPTTFSFEAIVTTKPITGFSATRLVERKFKLMLQGPVTEAERITGT